VTRHRGNAYFLFLWILVIAVMAAGCETSVAVSTEEAPNQNTPSNAYKARIRIVVDNADRPFPEGLGPNNNPYVTYIEQHTGIDLQMIHPPTSSYQESLNIIMNSNDVPDVINTADPSWVSKFVEADMLLPLDDLLQTHGRELYGFFPEEAWEAVTFNNKIYAIPSLVEVSGNEVIYARKDWLDALGLEPPRTLDEYYEVMRAFRYDDPDGNGKIDTWGLTILPTGLSRTAPFFGAFGVPRGGNQITQWKEQEGELVYSGVLDKTQEALEFLARLYGEGILDREFILNKHGSFEDKIADGRVGLFSAAWYDTKGPILRNMKQDPEAEWIRLEYPIGPDGNSGTSGLDIVQSYTVIPKSSSRAKEVIEVLTFIAGEGYRELKLGFEGEVWTKQNGIMQTDFEQHEAHIYRGTLHSIADPNDPAVRRDRLDSLGSEYRMNDNVDYILAHALRSDFQGPPTPSMGRFGAQLLKLEDETFAKIIMGMDPGKELYDQFVRQWEADGWEIKNEVNAWYRNQAERGP